MAREPRSLAGKVVAITGGARGIGRATAVALVRRGAKVAIGDLDPALTDQAAKEIGAGTIGLPLDVTDRTSFEAFLDAVEQRLGPLDVLVNNAGIMLLGSFTDEDDAVTDRQIDINLRGVATGSKLALRRFLPRRSGHLVNVASTAGKSGIPGGATYSATKFAVVGLTEAIRAEIRGSGVETSVVMPVPVRTRLAAGLQKGRGVAVVEPEDVAAEIVDALEQPRHDVFVPRSIGRTVRAAALLPRGATEAVGRLMKTDRVLAGADSGARAAYEREAGLAAAAPALPPAPEPIAAPEAAGEPEHEHETSDETLRAGGDA
ncbi:SDR family oxidoreductase [Conexibacter sp. JD483]|uniref:SDR family oxidoreductase n=1 Tax=unclassified Conexibacter TaxID=2627773 RepID=UPI00271EAFDD|nr:MULTISPECIES: SDR family oxidoreductase [unclassified Conexibacter]MDO8184413.1 SDR family oxidoreductase [Conexibacter sp. CPCC 205706]MDO8197719.1 SDR family oxidoreductase [Conexibacter sp. CPCC 205762]MDR9368145.1 SDR family oxidoreductase [Conexibacter sp. JD483]